MFDFAEKTKDMTAAEILNYYRNLYYAEPQVTERGIVANAINDYFNESVPKSNVEVLQRKYDLAVEERAANVKAFVSQLESVEAEVATETVGIVENVFEKYINDITLGDSVRNLLSLISDEIQNEIKNKYTAGE